MLVVDGGIKTEILGDPRALVVGAGDANDAAAVNFSNLPDDAACCASGGGDDERLAFLGRSDLHAEESSEAIGAEHSEKNGVRDEGNLRNLLEETLGGSIDDDVFLQARQTRDAV